MVEIFNIVRKVLGISTAAASPMKPMTRGRGSSAHLDSIALPGGSMLPSAGFLGGLTKSQSVFPGAQPSNTSVSGQHSANTSVSPTAQLHGNNQSRGAGNPQFIIKNY
jgi:hypothetical protein